MESNPTHVAKRVVIAVFGGAVLVAGLLMLVLPGPGVVAIIAGLAILATEFSWAERRLSDARAKSANAVAALRRPRRLRKVRAEVDG